MAVFEMSKYLPKEETQEVSQDVQVGTDSPNKEEKKEVRIVKVGPTSASEIVATALIEALRREDIELIEKPEESANGIFNNVKIISTEDINNNLRDALEFAQDEDAILVTDMMLPSTPKEAIFDEEVVNNNPRVYRSLVDALKDIYHRGNAVIDEAEGIVDDAISEAEEDFHNVFPGEKVMIDDVPHEAVFRDSYVIIFREESDQPCDKHHYKIFNCHKGA